MNKLNAVKSKIISRDDLGPKLAYWNFKNYKLVFTNGCFDIIHKGHIEYLAKAANLGDVLIIGLNTDSSVKKIKGNKRPYQDEQSRAYILASLQFVDLVTFFDEETPYALIETIKPHILVKGSEYQPEEIAGGDLVTASGGKIVTIDMVKGYSTTSIINKIAR